MFARIGLSSSSKKIQKVVERAVCRTSLGVTMRQDVGLEVSKPLSASSATVDCKDEQLSAMSIRAGKQGVSWSGSAAVEIMRFPI